MQSMSSAASEISNVVSSAASAMTSNGDAGKTAQSMLGSNGTESKKIKDLQKDMVDIHSSQPMTTDFGHKVANTDNWLKIASDKSTGPHLLEDQQAREKVGTMTNRRDHGLKCSADPPFRSRTYS